jgi:hypothetical protein
LMWGNLATAGSGGMGEARAETGEARAETGRAGDKHGICPPMKSSLFRVFMTRHVLGYAPEASVLRFPSSWLGRNH